MTVLFVKLKKSLKTFFYLLSLDKIMGLVIGALILASLKYIISGSFSINWDEFNLNATLGICGGIIRIFVKEYLSEYLNIKGINE